jgi:hypothetical protein
VATSLATPYLRGMVDGYGEARDNVQSIAEGCFKNTVRTTLCDLCKEHNIGTRQPDRFGNHATQLIYVKIELSLRKAQMFVATSDVCKA